jgi:spermidine/putrescine transport system permease protein
MSLRRHRVFALFWGTPLLIWQAAFFLVPLGFLIAVTFWSVRNFRVQPDATLANWSKILATDYVWDAYFRSLALSAGCAVIATALAFPLAYFVAFRLSLRARLLATCLLIVPFFTSYLVRVYTWRTMLGLHGAVNSLLSTLGIPPQVMTDNFFGLMIGFLTLTLPLVCLLQILSLSLVDKRLVEAAWNLGAGPATTVRTIIIPSARAGLILGSAFAFVLSFGDFVSPDLLGGRNPPLISLLIIDQVKGGSNWPRAAVIAMMMILTLLLVVSAAGRLAYPKRK